MGAARGVVMRKRPVRAERAAGSRADVMKAEGEGTEERQCETLQAVESTAKCMSENQR